MLDIRVAGFMVRVRVQCSRSVRVRVHVKVHQQLSDLSL